MGNCLCSSYGSGEFMGQSDIIKYKNYGIAVLVVVFAFFALWIRLLPMFNMGNTDILEMVAMDDPLYNLRQVEVMLAQFPGYAWFEPMTLYPTGTTIYWGPLFPTIIAIVCLATGATTRPGIISAALLIPPLLAVATVVVMYFTGQGIRGLENRCPCFRFYGNCRRAVSGGLFLRVHRSPHCRSPVFNHLLPGLWLCPFL